MKGWRGRGGGAGPRMREKEKRTKEQKPQSRIGDSRTDGQSRPLAVRIKRHKDCGTVIFSDPRGFWQRINDQDI